MVKFSASFAVASALSVASAQIVDYEVTISSLAFEQPFSQPIIVAHTNDIALFKPGLPASAELQAVAENGDNSGMLALLESDEIAPFVCGSLEADFGVDESGEPIIYLFGGGTFTATLSVDTSICSKPRISVVGMLINTNDGFMGIDAERFFEGETTTFRVDGHDAGTEENTEDCSDVPGPACSVESGNAAIGGGEGFISIHRGVNGVIGAGLDVGIHGFLNPVAEVSITAL